MRITPQATSNELGLSCSSLFVSFLSFTGPEMYGMTTPLPKTGKFDAYGWQICKRFQDGRECYGEHCQKAHCCDILISANAICGSYEHTRYEHDGPVWEFVHTAGKGHQVVEDFWNNHGNAQAASPASVPRPPVSPPPPVAVQRAAALMQEAKELLASAEFEVPTKQEEPSIPEPEEEKYTKDYYSELSYWDRNWNAIIFDAAQKADEYTLLHCPADGCSWRFHLNSKASSEPEWSLRQHIQSKVAKKDPEHPDTDAWYRIANSTRSLESSTSGPGSKRKREW